MRGAILAALCGGALLGCGSGGGGTAAATGVSVTTPTASASPASALTRKTLAQGAMNDALKITASPPTELVVQQVTIAAGGVVPWHTHPGWENSVLTSGQLTLTISTDPGCAPRHLSPGQAFDVPVNTPHTATNSGGVAAILIVTYLGVPPGATIANPTAKPAGC